MFYVFLRKCSWMIKTYK